MSGMRDQRPEVKVKLKVKVKTPKFGKREVSKVMRDTARGIKS